MSTRIDNAQPHRPIAATVDADSDLYLHLSGADFCRSRPCRRTRSRPLARCH